MDEPVLPEHVEAALGAEHIDVVLGDADSPNNLSSAGQGDVMVRVRTYNGEATEAKRFWIWASIDNLKFGALNALACAQELRKLRPLGKVQ